jgi:hypothetical protein
MGSITVKKLKFLMNKRNIDVEVVTLPSIMGSTEYNKELFLIQGYARRGKKLKKDKNGLPEAIPMWRAKKGSKPDDPFFEHTILLEPSVGRYIDHVLRSKNGCLILNPASHLKLHDNLKGGYFTKDSVFRVSFVFRWVVGRGKYYIDGPNDGYPVDNKRQREIFQLVILKQLYLGTCT